MSFVSKLFTVLVLTILHGCSGERTIPMVRTVPKEPSISQERTDTLRYLPVDLMSVNFDPVPAWTYTVEVEPQFVQVVNRLPEGVEPPPA